MQRPLINIAIAMISLLALAFVAVFVFDFYFRNRLLSNVVQTVAVCSASILCLLICHQSRRPTGRNYLCSIGLVLVLISSPLFLIVVWSGSGLVNEHLNFLRITQTIGAFAFATVHICLLSMARLDKRFEWVLGLARFVNYGLALLATYYIFFTSGSAQRQQDVEQWISALIVAAIAMTAIIPLLYALRSSKSE